MTPAETCPNCGAPEHRGMCAEPNPRAFSVLGFRDPNARAYDRPNFAAYSPTAEAAKEDRRTYAFNRPDLKAWAIIDHATGRATWTLSE